MAENQEILDTIEMIEAMEEGSTLDKHYEKDMNYFDKVSSEMSDIISPPEYYF